MNQQKGFSLIEVLVSLMLVTTLALALLQQQCHTKLLIKQLTLRAGASQLLDQVDESLYLKADKIPVAHFPYELKIKRSEHLTTFKLSWFNELGSITRSRRFKQ